MIAIRGGSSADRRRDKDARSTRSYTHILSRQSRPAQRGGNCEKSLTETAAIVTHCVILLPFGGSEGPRGEISKTRSIGQLSVWIKYYYYFILAGVELSCKNSIKLERVFCITELKKTAVTQ